MTRFRIRVWQTERGLHLDEPPNADDPSVIWFDPDARCRVCGDAVLTVAASGTDICPWCDSGTNRPKMLAYQEWDIRNQIRRRALREGGNDKPATEAAAPGDGELQPR